MKCIKCKAETSNPKFCSRSCAMSINNKGTQRHKALSLSEIKSRLKTISPSIQLLSTTYKNARQSLGCKCTVCNHIWKSNWSRLSQGNGCIQCGYRKTGTGKRIPLHQMISSLKEINPKIEVLDQPTFNTLSCKCRVCGHNWTAKYSTLKLNGCKSCAVNARTFSLDEIRVRENVPQDTQLKRLENSRVELICSEGHKRIQSVGLINQCSECSRLDKFRNTLPKSIVLISTYYKNPMKLQCIECNHSWFSSPYQNQLCRQCHPHSIFIKESEVRIIIERLTGWEFPKIKAAASPIDMELDGYNAEHKVAFEYQGEWHYRPHWSYTSKPKALGYSALRRQKLRDHKKQMRGRRAGILLIRVPYFKRNVEAFIQAKLSSHLSAASGCCDDVSASGTSSGS